MIGCRAAPCRIMADGDVLNRSEFTDHDLIPPEAFAGLLECMRRPLRLRPERVLEWVHERPTVTAGGYSR